MKFELNFFFFKSYMKWVVAYYFNKETDTINFRCSFHYNAFNSFDLL